MNVFKENFRMFFKLWQALNKWDIITLKYFAQKQVYFYLKSYCLVLIIGIKNFKRY